MKQIQPHRKEKTPASTALRMPIFFAIHVLDNTDTINAKEGMVEISSTDDIGASGNAFAISEIFPLMAAAVPVSMLTVKKGADAPTI